MTALLAVHRYYTNQYSSSYLRSKAGNNFNTKIVRIRLGEMYRVNITARLPSALTKEREVLGYGSSWNYAAIHWIDYFIYLKRNGPG